MKIVTWNVRKATKKSTAWKILFNLKPDIALLQEVTDIPEQIKDAYVIKYAFAVGKHGKPQRFGTAILVKGKIIEDLPLRSEHDWVNKQLEHFAGNLVSCVVQPDGHPKINVISAYSPAWPIDMAKFSDVDVSAIKLKQNPKLWVTEILWSALKNAEFSNRPWIVGGDLNCSETFDLTFSSGNKEILDRMVALGLRECLRGDSGKLIPTFRNPRNGKILHQIDHLFVTKQLFAGLKRCKVGEGYNIFEQRISDHLPIIADFEDKP